MPTPRFRLYGGRGVYREVLASLLFRRTYRGDDVCELEKRLSGELGVPHAIAVPQGRVALYLAIRHTIRGGQNVVMSPYTIFDVVNMVLCAGGVPRFADIREDTCNLSPAALNSSIDSSTGAVVVTHLHGTASDLDAIAGICRDRSVPLIEDVAQAFDGRWNGRALGAVGETAIFSFGRAKNVNALYGGAVVTQRDDVAAAIRREVDSWTPESELRIAKRAASCGLVDLLTSQPVFDLLTFPVLRYAALCGLESVSRIVQTETKPFKRGSLPEVFRRRFTPMQARMVLRQLGDVQAHSAHRRALAAVYRERLAGLNTIRMLADDRTTTSIYLAFPVLVEDRQVFVKHLMRSGCDVAIQHINNVADLDCFSKFAAECPVARMVSRSLVLLPTYPGYSEGEARRTADAIREFARLGS